MRLLLAILLVLSASLWGGYTLVTSYPTKLYSRWIQGKGWNKYYTIEGHKADWLRPPGIKKITPYREDYAQLWKEFPLRNVKIPLPVRHPLFQTVPFVESQGEKSSPFIGMVFLNPVGRELSRVYTLPVTHLQDHTQGQELFKLPFVRNRILKLPPEKLWSDVFTREIKGTSKKLEDMIYELYLLHLRSKILPKTTINFGLLKDGRALMELNSVDKDYIIELVSTNINGSIYSFVLRTEVNNDESQKLRSKFLDSVSFIPVDPDMGKILYTEFKQLNFARQVDQEGMLYLFSAWSQDAGNSDMFKEMIFYLERGQRNFAQLKPLYAFAIKHFGKTFTTRNSFNENEDAEVALQRKIEIEKTAKAKESATENSPRPELAPDEKMNQYLKRVKEEGEKDKSEMTIH